MGRWITSAASALAIALTAAAPAQWSQIGDPLAPPPDAAGAHFGHSVSVSGALAIVGAPSRVLANGTRSGAAFVFDLVTRRQLHELFDDTLDEGAGFGFVVAIDGDLAIVAAPGDAHGGTNAGSAYVFDVVSGALLRRFALEEPEAGDLFGHGVALHEGVAIIGAPGDKHNPLEIATGAMYAFDVASGRLLHPRLASIDAQEGQAFGWSLAADGDEILVGAPEDGDAAGAAYVFHLWSGTQIRRLTPADPAPFRTFGHVVDVQNGVALIGGPGDGHTGSSAGSAYLFDTMSGEQLWKLTAADAAHHAAFGWSVALDGGRALIGASGDGGAGRDSGAAYLFDGGSGRQIEKWTAGGAGPRERFGHAVSLNGERALVGAILESTVAAESGAAFLFTDCPADLDGDGEVSTTDLVTVILSWDCTGPPRQCPGDVNADGVVDVDDLTMVILTWGGC